MIIGNVININGIQVNKLLINFFFIFFDKIKKKF